VPENATVGLQEHLLGQLAALCRDLLARSPQRICIRSAVGSRRPLRGPLLQLARQLLRLGFIVPSPPYKLGSHAPWLQPPRACDNRLQLLLALQGVYGPACVVQLQLHLMQPEHRRLPLLPGLPAGAMQMDIRKSHPKAMPGGGRQVADIVGKQDSTSVNLRASTSASACLNWVRTSASSVLVLATCRSSGAVLSQLL
jgi:hypothetical protein